MDSTRASLAHALGLNIEATVELPRIPGADLICAVAMPEERSFDRWQEVDELARRIRYVALGVGSEQRLASLREHLELVRTWDPGAALETAEQLDLGDWLAEQEAELTQDGCTLPFGDWQDPSGPPDIGFWFPSEKGRHLDPWWMVLVPAREPWQAPVSLAYGSWNACPHASVHAAFCRYWQRVYDAQLVAVGPDTLEFVVESPPSTKEAALALAREQYLYCSDIVEQGTGTISTLAASLINKTIWGFWWD